VCFCVVPDEKKCAPVNVPPETVERIHVNKIALVLSIAIASPLGFAPVALATGHPELIIGILVLSVMFSAFKIRSFKMSATVTPSGLEFMLGGIGAIFPAIAVGIAWLISYWLLFGIITLVEFVANWLGFGLLIDASFFAFWLSFIFLCLVCYVYITQGTDKLTQQLYPQTAGLKSAFYEMVISERKRKLLKRICVLSVVGGVVLAFALNLGVLTTWWFDLCLLLFLSGISLSLSEKRVLSSTIAISENEIAAIGKLLEASGYQVLSAPRTGRSEIDPLLVRLDLFAQKNEDGFAINVFTSSSEPTYSLDSVLALEGAALGLERFQRYERENFKVLPMIVFIGKDVDDTFAKLRNAARGVHIVEIPDFRVVNQILETKDKEELRNKAKQCLAISDNVEDLGDSVTDLGLKRGEYQ
jgi:hypothetical protein